jgi:hypothetical protein
VQDKAWLLCGTTKTNFSSNLLLTIKDGCSQKIERQNQRAVKSDIAKKGAGEQPLKLSLVLRTRHGLGGKRRNTIGRTDDALLPCHLLNKRKSILAF